jgi:phosphoglucosamine mutase
VMISASHNPAIDNGIKFFSSSGHKLPDQLEEEIERYLDQPELLPRPQGDQVGRVHEAASWQTDYLQYLKELASHRLDGLQLVLDCANGAAYRIAPLLFRQLGAQVRTINANPDGQNINRDCGSTHMAGLSAAVLSEQADMGLAFDGDADRLLAVDSRGGIVNGDAIMAICAVHLKQQGRLRHHRLVATTMSNLGLELAMREQQIELLRSDVGDRYVLAMMQDTEAVLGGEQSGHIIFSEHSTTGDGLLTALRLAEIVTLKRQSLAELASIVQPFPQVLKNARVADRSVINRPVVQAIISQVRQALGETGRILVRPSGTEPVIRVMVEAQSEQQAEQLANQVVAILQV